MNPNQHGDNVDIGRAVEVAAGQRWSLALTGWSKQSPWWFDARAREAIPARDAFGTIEAGTPIEIKGAKRRTHGDTRSGRWLIREHCHEKLLEADGEYLLCVYRETGGGRAFLVGEFRPAWWLDDRIGSWYGSTGRGRTERNAQVTWTSVFDALHEAALIGTAVDLTETRAGEYAASGPVAADGSGGGA